MHTLTILDWDDTLFPTNWVMKNNIDLHNEKSRSRYSLLFGVLDRILVELLNRLLKHGDVVIITNAMPEWVHLSMGVLPGTAKVINDSIDIISARKLYQHKVETIDWKKHTFRDHFVHHYRDKKNGYQNVISIGDAEYERRALVQLYGWDDHKRGKRFLKTIQFVRGPTLPQLIDQLMVLNKVTDRVCSLRKHIELAYSLK